MSYEARCHFSSPDTILLSQQLFSFFPLSAMSSQLSRSQRLLIIIGISFSFFVAEISGVLIDERNTHFVYWLISNALSVGFYTHSLALVADAFHYMNDLVGFIVALVALRISQRDNTPKALSLDWRCYQ